MSLSVGIEVLFGIHIPPPNLIIIKHMLPIFVGNGKSGRIIDSDMHEVGRFLNRILGLPPDIQNGFVFCELNGLMLLVSSIS